jgi:hypothetical protein
MFPHPLIHLEIARQRNQELRADAERPRIAKDCDQTGQHSAEAAWQIEYLASQRNRDAAPYPGIQNALESGASANRS